MAALLLGEVVVTLLPAPGGASDRRGAAEAIATVPRYLRLMESWRWTVPLWDAGVIGAMVDDEDVIDDIRAAWASIGRRPDLAPLRPLMHASLFEDDQLFLQRVAGDVLKGGPDPGVCVPIQGGLDRFAARHGLMAVRAQATSLAQRIEWKMGRVVFRVGLPILAQGDAERIIEARDLLDAELSALGQSFQEAACRIDDPEPLDADLVERICGEARRYAAAFESNRRMIVEPRDGDVRTLACMATLTGMRLPVDAALRSSAAAASRIGLAGMAESAPSTLPVLRDQTASGHVLAMFVKPIGRPLAG